MKKQVLVLGILGGFLLSAFLWNQNGSNHCATGNWVSSNSNESLEILADKIALFNRITTSNGWKDACDWNVVDEKSILLECRLLGSQKKTISRFQCGNTKKIGYFYRGIEPSENGLVMYRSE